MTAPSLVYIPVNYSHVMCHMTLSSRAHSFTNKDPGNNHSNCCCTYCGAVAGGSVCVVLEKEETDNWEALATHGGHVLPGRAEKEAQNNSLPFHILQSIIPHSLFYTPGSLALFQEYLQTLIPPFQGSLPYNLRMVLSCRPTQR